MKEFLRKKNIIFSAKRYGIDALGAMAQGLFASLLIGTIISTLGEQLGIGILVTVGGYAKAFPFAISPLRGKNAPLFLDHCRRHLYCFHWRQSEWQQMNLGVPEDLLRFWSLRFLQQNLENWFQKKQK